MVRCKPIRVDVEFRKGLNVFRPRIVYTNFNQIYIELVYIKHTAVDLFLLLEATLNR